MAKSRGIPNELLPDGKIRLMNSYRRVVDGRVINVPACFVSDLVSWIRKSGKASYAGLIHDWLYEQGLVSQKEADRLFLICLKEDGVSFLRRQKLHKGLRLFGWYAWRKHRKRERDEMEELS